MKNLVICLLLCLGMTGTGACLADTTPHEEFAYQATVSDDGIQHVQIEGGSNFFKPNRLVVKVNVPVELVVSVEKGLIPHTLVMLAPEAGISVDESLSSDAKKILFTPSAVGKFPFYCKNKLLFFASHRDKGMEGVLEVVE